MKFSTFNPNNAGEIEQLFIKTFSDSEGQSEEEVIGQKLINFGLDVLKENGVELAITYGDPDFYSKVGFTGITEQVVPAPQKLEQPEGWLAQSLIGDEIKPISGKSHCVEALNKPELW